MAKKYLEMLSAFIEGAAIGCPQKTSFECKHFFGGAALYVNKKICITLTPAGLAVKLPLQTRESLFQKNIAIPLRYFSGGPVKKDYALFRHGFENPEQALIGYVKEGINHVLSLPRPIPDKKPAAGRS